MNTTERQTKLEQQTAELYQAVGEFAVKFEHVTHAMQQGIVSLLDSAGLKNQQLSQILLAELTAHPLKSILQALLAEIVSLSKEDQRICDSVFTRTQKLIEQRNEIIHSTWFVGWAHPDDTEFSEAWGSKLSRGKIGASLKSFNYQVESFRRHAAECDRVAGLLRRLQVCALGRRSITGNFSISKAGRVSERGVYQETP